MRAPVSVDRLKHYRISASSLESACFFFCCCLLFSISNTSLFPVITSLMPKASGLNGAYTQMSWIYIIIFWSLSNNFLYHHHKPFDFQLERSMISSSSKEIYTKRTNQIGTKSFVTINPYIDVYGTLLMSHLPTCTQTHTHTLIGQFHFLAAFDKIIRSQVSSDVSLLIWIGIISAILRSVLDCVLQSKPIVFILFVLFFFLSSFFR